MTCHYCQRTADGTIRIAERVFCLHCFRDLLSFWEQGPQNYAAAVDLNHPPTAESRHPAAKTGDMRPARKQNSREWGRGKET